MTYEELQKAADEMGFELREKPKEPKIELLKHCGVYPKMYWSSILNDNDEIEKSGFYFICPICGMKTDDWWHAEQTARIARKKKVKARYLI